MALYKLTGNHPDTASEEIKGTPINRIIINPCKKFPTGAQIPMVEDNSDYQTYLKWVAAGNTPDAAD